MGNKYKKIVEDIMGFCNKVGVLDFSKVHIGTTKDVQRRLFEEHRITNEGYWWICCKAKDANTARAVELHFIRMGMRGGTGGGDNETIFVYCFVKKQA